MSRPTLRRPVLLPALRRLWRDQHRLQLGTDPHRAVILELGDAGCARLLDLLDGSRTEAAVLREAVRGGVAAGEAAAALAALRQAGFVHDAHALHPVGLPEPARRRLDRETAALALRGPASPAPPAQAMRRRRAARVRVTGASQLAVPIAGVLASSGVGWLDPDVTGITRLYDASPAGLLPSDAHRPRGVAAAEAVRRVAPDAEVAPLRRGGATFAVLVGFAAPIPLTALSHETRRLDHLAVTVRDGTVVIGPLVRPGQTPCLNCIDLHRLDRDQGWSVVAAQLHTAPETAEPLNVTTALAAVAYAAEEVLTHIDGGRPGTVGATVEIAGPGLATRRSWSAHPVCGCQRRRFGHNRLARPRSTRGP